MSFLTLALLSSARSLCVVQAGLELLIVSLRSWNHRHESSCPVKDVCFDYPHIMGKARFSDSIAVHQSSLKIETLSNMYYYVTVLRSGIQMWFNRISDHSQSVSWGHGHLKFQLGPGSTSLSMWSLEEMMHGGLEITLGDLHQDNEGRGKKKGEGKGERKEEPVLLLLWSVPYALATRSRPHSRRGDHAHGQMPGGKGQGHILGIYCRPCKLPPSLCAQQGWDTVSSREAEKYNHAPCLEGELGYL